MPKNASFGIRNVNFHNLGIPSASVGPVLAQYWARVQGRIVCLGETVYDNSDDLPFH